MHYGIFHFINCTQILSERTRQKHDRGLMIKDTPGNIDSHVTDNLVIYIVLP